MSNSNYLYYSSYYDKIGKKEATNENYNKFNNKKGQRRTES